MPMPGKPFRSDVEPKSTLPVVIKMIQEPSGSVGRKSRFSKDAKFVGFCGAPKMPASDNNTF